MLYGFRRRQLFYFLMYLYCKTSPQEIRDILENLKFGRINEIETEQKTPYPSQILQLLGKDDVAKAWYPPFFVRLLTTIVLFTLIVVLMSLHLRLYTVASFFAGNLSFSLALIVFSVLIYLIWKPYFTPLPFSTVECSGSIHTFSLLLSAMMTLFCGLTAYAGIQTAFYTGAPTTAMDVALLIFSCFHNLQYFLCIFTFILALFALIKAITFSKRYLVLFYHSLGCAFAFYQLIYIYTQLNSPRDGSYLIMIAFFPYFTGLVLSLIHSPYRSRINRDNA